MSRYADLRWKIADLEKALNEEKIYSKKLRKERDMYINMLYAKEKDIEVIMTSVKNMGKKDGADNDR